MRSIPFVGCLAFAFAVSTLLMGCRKKEVAPPPFSAPVVTVAQVEEREIVEWEEFTGRTAAIDNVEVRPRVSGHIESVKFQAGQVVKKDDVLFQIDPRWHQAILDQRLAELEQAKVKLATAERESQRTAQLLSNKAISAEESEQRQSRYQEAKAALVAAEAGRDMAKLDLDYSTIRSPIDGRISHALVTEGNYVTAGNGTILATIVSIDPIHVYVDMDENTLLQFADVMRQNRVIREEGKVPIEMQLANEQDFPHRGTLESLGNQLDPTSGSILLRAVFENPNGEIFPGLFARIRVPVSGKHSAILIDDAAIGTDQAQKYALAVTPTNTVEYRSLKLGPLYDGKRVVREGLKAGETIVINGLQRVRPGSPIQPQAAAPAVGTNTTAALSR